MVVSELRGEKIDIIPFNEEPARFVAKALSPARVREVLVDDETKQATVIVPDDQLSLAIGKEGQNARLAARLTGWRVDIRSETEFAEEEAEMGYEEEEISGRCAAILSNGHRCPNAALPGSRYCGLPPHQALADEGHRLSCRWASRPEELGRRRAGRRGGHRRPERRQAGPPGRQATGRGDAADRRSPGENGGRTRGRGRAPSSSRGEALARARRSPRPGEDLRRLRPDAPEGRAAPASCSTATRCAWTGTAGCPDEGPTSARDPDAAEAVGRRGFQRSFRRPVTITSETLDLIDSWRRSAFTR